MSIQETISSQRGRSVLWLKAINRLYMGWQKAARLFHVDEPRVYYPYRNLLHTHPFFLRYYKHAPLAYSNLHDASLCHWVNQVPAARRGVPYVVEPNDHPLAVTGKSEPWEVLGGIETAIEVYTHRDCKRILVESEGQLGLFKRYLPESVLRKTEIIRMGAMPHEVDFAKRASKVETPAFLCLASDYRRKAVDIVIKAWRESRAKSRSRLVLACPNVPQEMTASLEKENIRLIQKAPLSEREKFELHSAAHVVIAPLHVDGGANVIEAMEHGLPAITMRSQRSFVREGNGWEVDVPFYFYDEGYGREWPTWERFWELLEAAKNDHAFDMTVQGFVNTFNDIAQSPEKLVEKGMVSYDLAKGEFSLETRNAALRRIYREALQ